MRPFTSGAQIERRSIRILHSNHQAQAFALTVPVGTDWAGQYLPSTSGGSRPYLRWVEQQPQFLRGHRFGVATQMGLQVGWCAGEMDEVDVSDTIVWSTSSFSPVCYGLPLQAVHHILPERRSMCAPEVTHRVSRSDAVASLAPLHDVSFGGRKDGWYKVRLWPPDSRAFLVVWVVRHAFTGPVPYWGVPLSWWVNSQGIQYIVLLSLFFHSTYPIFFIWDTFYCFSIKNKTLINNSCFLHVYWSLNFSWRSWKTKEFQRRSNCIDHNIHHALLGYAEVWSDSVGSRELIHEPHIFGNVFGEPWDS